MVKISKDILAGITGGKTVEGILDTPEKIRKFEEDMRAATEEAYKLNEKARRESWARIYSVVLD